MARRARVKQHIVQGLGQGLRAGLVVAVVVSLLEILGLMLVDRSLAPWNGLLYALVAYGLLGLLGGLGLGLLWGLVQRDKAGPAPWAVLTALLTLLGTFAVVYNRLRRDVVRTPADGIESLFAAGVALAAGVVLAVGLWLLLRRQRAGRLRWSAGLYLALLLVAVLIGGVSGLAAASHRQSLPSGIPADMRDAPNVVFIVADTLRADHLSCYALRPMDGETQNHTPHIDALARDGVLYRRMSAPAPWTKPSVATMLTSLYPSSHGATLLEHLLPDAVVTLPEILQAQGYRTAGLSTNRQIAPTFNFQQGFDELTFLAPNLPFFASPVSQRFTVYSALNRLRAIVRAGSGLLPGEVYQDAATLNERALAWLAANRSTRFFLYLHFMDPHMPYFAHPYDGTGCMGTDQTPDDVARSRQLYAGEVAYLDGHLGVLFDRLRAWGLYDDALIVFTGDHGEEFYEHEGWGHGHTLYREQLAVPLIVKYPGNVDAGMVDEGFARSLDLAPTVLDVLGFPAPAVMQGVSLRPGTTMPRAEAIFAEGDLHDNVVRAIRTRQRKLIIANEDNPRGLPAVALFDLQADPGEQRSLAAAEPDTVRLLRAELERVMALAEAHAVTGQSTELDAAIKEQLRNLGY